MRLWVVDRQAILQQKVGQLKQVADQICRQSTALVI
jgi:hypothetical protein